MTVVHLVRRKVSAVRLVGTDGDGVGGDDQFEQAITVQVAQADVVIVQAGG